MIGDSTDNDEPRTGVRFLHRFFTNHDEMSVQSLNLALSLPPAAKDEGRTGEWPGETGNGLAGRSALTRDGARPAQVPSMWRSNLARRARERGTANSSRVLAL